MTTAAPTRFEPSLRAATPEEAQALLAGEHDEFVDEALNSMIEGVSASTVATTIGDGKRPALRFDVIRDIVQMNRRLAEASLHAATAEMISARDADARARAHEAIQEAQDALLYANNAEVSLLSAEHKFRSASLFLVAGDEPAAQLASKDAAGSLAATAAATEKFGPAAMKSRFFSAILTTMYAADNAVAAAERRTAEFKAKMQRRADGFASSMSDVASRIRSFAKAVVNFPTVAREVANQKGTQLAEASVIVSRNMATGLRGWFASKAEAFAGKVKESAAWQFVSEQSSKAATAAQSVVDHASAAVLLAGSAVSAVGSAYQDQLAQVRDQRSPRP